MMRKAIGIIFCLVIANSVQASTLTSILRSLLRSEGIQVDMLRSQRDINSLMKQLDGHMTGNSGWGNYHFRDNQSYGLGGDNWSSLLNMAASGNGGGDLGPIINKISQDFPIDQHTFENGSISKRDHRYYALKSQTVLAARAASQLDFNKIQQQIAYQQMLREQIEKTKDIKAAMDLSNRIHLEGNLIQLEILRLLALSNQQQAIAEQGSLNTALTNAKFLAKP